jgi:hypothetical protein
MLKEYLERRNGTMKEIEEIQKGFLKTFEDIKDKKFKSTLEYLKKAAVEASEEEFNEFLDSEEVYSHEKLAAIIKRITTPLRPFEK